jgi:predicted transcriptional regulator
VWTQCASYPVLRSDQASAAVDRAHGISERDRAVYQQLATYCFGEAVCWPSHDILARDLGLSRLAVTRAMRRLEVAGWLRKTERRWSPRTRWMHNVYELLEAWTPISPWVAEHIVRRSKRRDWARFSARYAAVNTNVVGGHIACPPNPTPSRADKLHDRFLGVPGPWWKPRRHRAWRPRLRQGT